MSCEKCKDQFEKLEERIRILEGCTNQFADDIGEIEKSDLEKRVIFLEDKIREYLP